MPISVYRGSLDQDALTTLGSPGYIAFFSDLKKDGSGQLWCPDCRGSVSAIESVFGGASSPQAHYVYADYASWKETRPGKLHKFKTEFDVQCVPTIIRFEQGREVARLADVPNCASVDCLKKIHRLTSISIPVAS